MNATPGVALGDRALFPDLEARAYLNHSAIAPPSTLVRQAVQGALDDYARRGVGAAATWFAQRDALRGDLARLIGAAAPESIALVPNTTQGVIDIALCMPWRRGDRVVVFEGEFPANVTPWQQAARLFDLKLVWMQRDTLVVGAPLATDEAGELLGRVEAALKDGARLVAISAVQFQTGWRVPLAALGALCRAHDARLFVDGIQACGVVPLDVEALGVDYLACGGHKWLMGVEGAGFLYIAPERVAELVPRIAGWLSHASPLRFLSEGAGHLRYDRPVRQRADFVEVGMQSTLGYAALAASVGVLLELGVEQLFTHVTAYLDALEPRLVRLGLESARRSHDGASGILSLKLPDDHNLAAVQAAMAQRGVACSTPDGYLRFAPHWPNALDEVDDVAQALEESLRASR